MRAQGSLQLGGLFLSDLNLNGLDCRTNNINSKYAIDSNVEVRHNLQVKFSSKHRACKEEKPILSKMSSTPRSCTR